MYVINFCSCIIIHSGISEFFKHSELSRMDFLLFYALFYKTFSSYFFLTNEVLIHLYQKEEREKENKE